MGSDNMQNEYGSVLPNSQPFFAQKGRKLQRLDKNEDGQPIGVMNEDFLRTMNRGTYDPKQYHDASPAGYTTTETEWEGAVDTRTAQEKDDDWFAEVNAKAEVLAREAHHSQQTHIPYPKPIEGSVEVQQFQDE